MIKKLVLLILIGCNQLVAQDQNSVWIFGDSAGIDFSALSNPSPISSGMRGRGSCVSIADSSGNLLLYSFTVESTGAWSTHIFNNTDSSITGADSITGEAWYNELILFPKPGSDSLYYLFSIGTFGAPNPGLYYTLVDMSLNGGLGGVAQENIQIAAVEYGDCLTAIKHGNGRDWWVISKVNNFPFTFFNRFYVYLVTSDSIFAPLIQDFNDASDVSFQKIVWHPFLSKFMLINVRGYMKQFNFDRCTGSITSDMLIFPELSNLSRAFWEGAYSPNGNVFYASRTSYGGNAGDYNYLLQYDLTAANIPMSCDTLDSTLYPTADCGAVRLAPDGKIYYTQAYPWGFPYQDTMYNYVNQNLGVINDPNVVGSGCNFAPFSFYLGGKRTYYGLPNNPNYSLGPVIGSPCDTLTGLPKIENQESGPELFVFYHAAWQTIFMNAKRLKGKKYSLYIYDMFSKAVFKEEGTISSEYFTKHLQMQGFSKGMYMISFITEKEKLIRKFIKN